MADGYSVGYGLIDQQGHVFPDTVASSERAAMVNALGAIFGEMVYATDGDAKIKAMFDRKKLPGFRVAPVSIEPVIVTPDRPVQQSRLERRR